VLFFPYLELLLIVFLLGGVVELAKNTIILMGFPILIYDLLIPLFDILLKSLLVILFVSSAYKVVLSGWFRKHLHLPFDRKPHLSVLVKVVSHLLIVYHIVNVSHWTQFLIRFGLIRICPVKVHNVIVFIVLSRVFLK
jgi:hypothetical protein